MEFDDCLRIKRSLTADERNWRNDLYCNSCAFCPNASVTLSLSFFSISVHCFSKHLLFLWLCFCFTPHLPIHSLICCKFSLVKAGEGLEWRVVVTHWIRQWSTDQHKCSNINKIEIDLEAFCLSACLSVRLSAHAIKNSSECQSLAEWLPVLSWP